MTLSIAHVFLVFLFVVLLTSGCAKLWSRDSFRQTLEGLGLAPSLAAFGMWAVPLFEVLVAVLLLLEATQRLAEIGLVLLVLSFAWSVYRVRKQNLSLSCNCFGNLTNEQFGKLTVLRILVLAVLDAYLLAVPSASLAQAAWEEWAAAILLSVGTLMIYAVATAYYEFKQSWEQVVTR